MPEQHLPDALYPKAKVAFSEQALESLLGIVNEMVRHDRRACQTDAAFADATRLMASQARGAQAVGMAERLRDAGFLSEIAMDLP